MAKSRPIILTGSISIDRIMNFGGKYREMIRSDKLHVLSLSVLIDSLVDSPGGTAANIAYSLALLGQTSTLLASIGIKDQEYINRFKKLGIDMSHVWESPLPTPTFTVLTDIEDNQVGGFYPGAMADHASLTLAPWYGQNPLVVISANDPGAMRKFVQECTDHNLEYVYDVGQQVSNISSEDIKAGLDSCTVLMVNDYELGAISDKTGITLPELEAKIPIIVTTLGKMGSTVSGNKLKNKITVNAVPDVKVVDPTGAGDAYRAGFLYGYLRNLNLETCAGLGNITASFAVGHKGTQEHDFSLAQISDIYYDTYGSKLERLK